MRLSILVFASVALGACTGDQKKPTPGDISAAAPVRDSQAGTVSTTLGKPDTTRDTTRVTTQKKSKTAGKSNTTASPKTSAPDSAIILAEASQPEHRTTRDSI